MMKGFRSMKISRWPILLLFILATPLLSACEDAEAEYMAQLAVDWAVQKGIMSLNCSGPGGTDCEYDLNETMLGIYIGGVKLGTAFGRSPELQAALDAGDVILNQEQADELVKAGAESGDLDKIDQAIEARPEDWSYRDQRGAVLLSQGNVQAADASFAEAEALVQERISAGESCQALQRNLLNNRIAALETQLEKNPADAELNDRFAGAHEELQALESGGPGSPCGG
jgi:hypothetical protein